MVRNKQNTPGIIKYPFWQMTYQNPEAVYTKWQPQNLRLPLLHGGIERIQYFAVSYSVLLILTIFIDKNG